MKSRKRLIQINIVILLLAVTFFHCGIFDSDEAAKYNFVEYANFEPGNKWYYSDGHSIQVTDETKIIDGVTTRKVILQDSDNLIQNEYIEIQSNTVRYYGTDEFVYEPPMSLGSGSIKVGESLSQTIALISSTSRDTNRMEIIQTLISDNDKINTPAGIFENCLNLRNIIKVSDYSINDTSYAWYAKNIGNVKNSFAHVSIIIALDSALVNGKRLP